MRMFRQNAGYLWQMALFHAGKGGSAEEMLREAMWAAYCRAGVKSKNRAFCSAVIREMELCSGDGESMRPDDIPGPAGEAFSGWDSRTQRACVAVWECGWPERDAAKACGIPVKWLRRRMAEIQAMSGGEEFPDALHEWLAACPAPDMRDMLRDFEARAAKWRRPRHMGRKICAGIGKGLAVAVACAVFYLMAILLSR